MTAEPVPVKVTDVKLPKFVDDTPFETPHNIYDQHGPARASGGHPSTDVNDSVYDAIREELEQRWGVPILPPRNAT